MVLGTLVMTKKRWTLRGRQVGVVVETDGDVCRVMWSVKGSYVLNEHLRDALLDLDSSEEGCT
jgi:hypothetical protein